MIGLLQVLCKRGTKTTDIHKAQRIGSALTVPIHYQEEGDRFLERIMTEDETYVHFMIAEMKEQPRQWMCILQTKEIQTNIFELKNDSYSVLRLHGNFVDGIHCTRLQ